MAIRNKTALAAQITRLIDTAGDPKITAADMRSVLTDFIDSLAFSAQVPAGLPTIEAADRKKVLRVASGANTADWEAAVQMGEITLNLLATAVQNRLLPASIGSNGQVLKVASGVAAWAAETASSGSTTFLALTDTPATFGTAGQILQVNSMTDALEFANAPNGAATWARASSPSGQAPYSRLPFNAGQIGRIPGANVATDDRRKVWSIPSGGDTAAWNALGDLIADGTITVAMLASAVTDRMTPASLGSAGQVLKVNSAGDGIIWGTDATGAGGTGISENDALALIATWARASSPTGTAPYSVLPISATQIGRIPSANTANTDRGKVWSIPSDSDTPTWITPAASGPAFPPAAWDTSTSYTAGDTVTEGNRVWEAAQDNSGNDPTSDSGSNWTLVHDLRGNPEALADLTDVPARGTMGQLLAVTSDGTTHEYVDPPAGTGGNGDLVYTQVGTEVDVDATVVNSHALNLIKDNFMIELEYERTSGTVVHMWSAMRKADIPTIGDAYRLQLQGAGGEFLTMINSGTAGLLQFGNSGFSVGNLKVKVWNVSAVGPKGDKGDKGDSATERFKGAWSAGVFAVGDIVFHSGRHYTCTAARTAGDTDNPITDSGSWRQSSLTAAQATALGRIPGVPTNGSVLVWKTDALGNTAWRAEQGFVAPETWTMGKTYNAPDHVIYQHKIYRALLSSSSANPATETANWVEVGDWYDRDKGAWAAGIFAVGDLVSHGGRHYICVAARVAANTGNPATDTASWRQTSLTAAEVTALGRIPSASPGNSKVWKTDGSGTPGWRDDATGSGGTSGDDAASWAEEGDTSAIPATKLANAPFRLPAAWSNSTAYADGDYVLLSSVIYEAVQATTGDDPSTDDGTNWTAVLIGTDANTQRSDNEIDTRVQAGVLNWAEAGNTSAIPAAKLGNSPFRLPPTWNGSNSYTAGDYVYHSGQIYQAAGNSDFSSAPGANAAWTFVADLRSNPTMLSNLADVPARGAAGEVLRVASGASEHEYHAPSILDASDTPASLGTAGQVLAVNTAADALEFVAQSGGGGTGGTVSEQVFRTAFDDVDDDAPTLATAWRGMTYDSSDTVTSVGSFTVRNNRVSIGTAGRYLAVAHMHGTIEEVNAGTDRAVLEVRIRNYVGGSTSTTSEAIGRDYGRNQYDGCQTIVPEVVEILELAAGDQLTAEYRLFNHDAANNDFEIDGSASYLSLVRLGGAKGDKGDQGDAGTTQYKGTWSAGIYALGDVVLHSGTFYICKAARTAANANNPSVDTASWQAIGAGGGSPFVAVKYTGTVAANTDNHLTGVTVEDDDNHYLIDVRFVLNTAISYSASLLIRKKELRSLTPSRNVGIAYQALYSCEIDVGVDYELRISSSNILATQVQVTEYNLGFSFSGSEVFFTSGNVPDTHFGYVGEAEGLAEVDFTDTLHSGKHPIGAYLELSGIPEGDYVRPYLAVSADDAYLPRWLLDSTFGPEVTECVEDVGTKTVGADTWRVLMFDAANAVGSRYNGQRIWFQ